MLASPRLLPAMANGDHGGNLWQKSSAALGTGEWLKKCTKPMGSYRAFIRAVSNLEVGGGIASGLISILQSGVKH